jgi:hypothetical protein
LFHAFLNFFSVKIIYDMLSLVGWVLISAAFVYGLELAGLQEFLTSIGHRDGDPGA